MRELYDVIEIRMNKPNKVKVIDVLLSAKNADAAVKKMGAEREGTPHFFRAVPAGEYRDGQPYRF
jgi:hypothetical protein